MTRFREGGEDFQKVLKADARFAWIEPVLAKLSRLTGDSRARKDTERDRHLRSTHS